MASSEYLLVDCIPTTNRVYANRPSSDCRRTGGNWRFLIRFCDGIEGHGLVDYEMGVWEEEILDRTKISISCILLILMHEMQVITRCIDEYQSAKVAGPDPPKPLFLIPHSAHCDFVGYQLGASHRSRLLTYFSLLSFFGCIG